MSPFANQLFVINKAAGPTSFDIVDAFRRTAGLRKVGHAGTLDPVATGVLLLCTEKATRAVEHFMNLEKTYEFTVHLGVETTTLDSEGDVVREEPCPPLADERIRDAIKSFEGEYEMEPPQYSAIKQGGRRLYELARAGEKAKVEPRVVNIYAIELIAVDLPHIECRVRCSRGTYVRSLARDIGRALNVPAHLASLVRSAVGPFTVDHAFPSENITAGNLDGLVGVPLDHALQFMPGIVLRDSATRALFDGACPTVADVLRTEGVVAGARTVRILDDAGRLLAVGRRTDVNQARPSWVESFRLVTDRKNVGC